MENIFVDAARLTWRGSSLIDALEYLLTVKGYSDAAAQSLVNVRNSRREKERLRVEASLAEAKGRKKADPLKLLQAADEILRVGPVSDKQRKKAMLEGKLP